MYIDAICALHRAHGGAYCQSDPWSGRILEGLFSISQVTILRLVLLSLLGNRHNPLRSPMEWVSSYETVKKGKLLNILS